MQTSEVKPLDELLAACAASAEFKAAVAALPARPSDLILWEMGLPPVKVQRLIAKILHEHPGLPLQSISVSGYSGCSSFEGTALLNDGEYAIAFDWNCGWRAEQMGWTDVFGFPDSARAAREFGYQCFREFVLRSSASEPAAG